MRAMMVMVAAMLAVPAVASEPTQVHVSTAGLDLATAKGQRSLEHRIAMAMVKLCGQPVLFSPDEIAALESCHAEAMNSAATQIDAARARRAVSVASAR